ncbi:hypothetical protein [Chryseobacterium vrystaatense]|uniref:Uncharacterized protein n=1 Tax=Chryseobacterium vrystaatense TaxID=307480 RepID=A0ABR4UUM2_9FLAO|nr:hypothetical protein [Chryseobacterium vrystaatense]KFF28464.1 hypothetical protein IW16_04505 [Chryseobacterium vrystaatense]
MIRVLSLFVFLLFVKLSGQENGKDSLNRAMPGGMGAFRADVESRLISVILSGMNLLIWS